MKKILFVSNTANFSKFNKPFMNWCTNQGWQVDYCAPGDEAVTECNHHYVVDIPREPSVFATLKAIRQLRKILKTQKYDIIHCHTPMGGCVARLAAKHLYKKHKVKIIYTAHGFHFYDGAPRRNWAVYFPIERYLLRYTDVLITINKEDYNRSVKEFSKYCKVCFMNGVGVDLSRFSKSSDAEVSQIRKDLGYKDDDFIITVVAELNLNKNQSFLIREVPELKKVIPNLKVLFIGKETLPLARNLVTDLGLEDTCLFLGYRKDVDLLTKMSNICFSASCREGLPVNIIEAMACGKVCVCSENRGHNSLLEDGVSGIIFDLKTPEKMDNAIISIYKDKTLAERLASTAYERAQQYDVKMAVEFTAGIYNSLVGEDK